MCTPNLVNVAQNGQDNTQTDQVAPMSPADEAALKLAQLTETKEYPGVETKNTVKPEDSTVIVKSGPPAITEAKKDKNTSVHSCFKLGKCSNNGICKKFDRKGTKYTGQKSF